MATAISEPRTWPRMMFSSHLCFVSLERIVFDADEIRRIVLGHRIGAFALFERELLYPRTVHQTREAVIPFDAAGLVIGPIGFIALFGEFLFRRPRFRPHG